MGSTRTTRRRAHHSLRRDDSPYSPIVNGVVISIPFSRLPPPPRTTDSAGLPSSCGTWAWARKLGGVRPETAFTVYLEGRSDRTVTLDKVDVHVSRRRAPMAGTRLDCLGTSRGTARELVVDLDSRPATVRYQAPAPSRYQTRSFRDPITGRTHRSPMQVPSLASPIKRPFLFTLHRGEIEIFLVSAFPQHRWCSWRMRFHYVSAGRRGTIPYPPRPIPRSKRRPPRAP
jgi:hypothetical protein